MKKLLLFCLILLIGVFCSACVNTMAIHQLNEKAVELMENGDPAEAISRWEAILDLDPTSFDAHYNLANAFITSKQCDRALEHAKKAYEVKPSAPVINYTLAVSYECAAEGLIKTTDEEGAIVPIPFASAKEEQDAYNNYAQYLTNANKYYDVYLTSLHNNEETNSIVQKIKENEELIKQYSPNTQQQEEQN